MMCQSFQISFCPNVPNYLLVYSIIRAANADDVELKVVLAKVVSRNIYLSIATDIL